MKFTMTKIAAAAALALAATGAQAVSVSTGGSFLMYDPANNLINTDNTISGFVDQDAGTWGVSSSMPFYGLNWSATGGALYTAPGAYSISTADAAPGVSGPNMNFTVGEGQVAGSIKFAWGSTSGIDVVNVWNVNADGSLTAAVVPGMVDGPFPGFHATFNLTGPGLISLAAPTAPVPEASTYGMMLAGLGLVGFAVRRRKLMA